MIGPGAWLDSTRRPAGSASDEPDRRLDSTSD
ncbi:hypothetical protein GX48_08053 [Paracoccidioides brasiliensis]|nr:hypothetical protein GX48_08053 [Paracoccidioides brasiliensis]